MNLVGRCLSGWLGILAIFAVSPLAPAAAESGSDNPEPAVLRVWNRDIAVFRAPVGVLTPSQRVSGALGRIGALDDKQLFGKVSSQPISMGEARGVGFTVGDTYLFSLLEADLDPVAGESLDEAAVKVVGVLKELQQAKIDQRRWPVILKGVGVSLGVTVALILLIFVLQRFRDWVNGYAERKVIRLRELRIRDYDLRPQLMGVFKRVMLLFSWLLLALCVYCWFWVVLAQFPFTAPWAKVIGGTVFGVIHTLLGGALDAIPGLIAVVIIVLVTRGIARFVHHLFSSLEQSTKPGRWMGQDTARATRRIAVVLVWLLGLVVAYPYVPGSDSNAFKGLSVFVGLVVSLGSTGLVNQFMSGFVVLYSGAVRTGEFVSFGSHEGTVIEIGMLSTKILTPAGIFVTVPNAVLVGETTINYSRLAKKSGAVTSTTVTIGYDVPWRQVHQLLLDAATKTPEVRGKPEPVVIQRALSDFFVEYELRFRVDKPQERRSILSRVHANILDEFAAAGVQIMSPHFEGQPEGAVLPTGPLALPGDGLPDRPSGKLS